MVVEDGVSEEDASAHARELEAAGYSIHMHVWTQAEFLRMIIHCRERHDEAFDVEAAARQGIEFVVVLRKQGNPPTSPPSPPPSAGTGRWRRLARRAAHRLRG
jgi:citrate lyase beta subunit